MNSCIKLFTYLKNLDLHCFSAYEAIAHEIKFSALKQLRRYNLWELSFANVELAKNKTNTKKIIDASYYLMNPNKEGYYLEQLPQHKLQKDEIICLVKVCKNYTFDQTQLIKKIQQKVGVNVAQIHKSLLWEFVLNKPAIVKADDLIKQLVDQVVVTKSISQGLLINPITENYSLITQKNNPYYQKT
jgi:phosphoribosylformylglycinamidine (FGAM) synthase PurS component